MQRHLLTFLAWWRDQLAGLVPDRLLRLIGNVADATVLSIENGVIVLRSRRNGVLTQDAQASADEAGLRKLAAVLKARGGAGALVVRLPHDWVLAKSLSLPLAALGNLRQILGFELERESPFSSNEVYWDYAVVRKDKARAQIDVALLVVPRKFVDPLLEAAKQAGLAPSALEIDAGGAVTRIWLEPAKMRSWPVASARLPRLALLAGGLAILAVLVPLAGQELALLSADESIDALSGQVEEARALRLAANRTDVAIDFLNRERARTPSALTALAAATRTLPDDSYLTEFSLHDGRVTVAGSSASAAQLIGTLAQSRAFEAPTFDAPVQSEDSGLESFTISASLKGVAMP